MEGQGGREAITRKDLAEGKDEKNDNKCGVSWLTFVRTKIAVLDIGLTNIDTGTDIQTAIEHFQGCNYYWGCATLLFVMLPTLPNFIDFMKTKIEEIKAGELCWLGTSNLIKTESPFLGLIYLLLVFFSYFCGGIALVTIYQVGYTLYCMVNMFLDPPGKDGIIVTKYQEKAHMGKFLECQLEAAPQVLLQFWILWSFGFTSWTQYISIVTSVISLAWGSTTTLLLLLHGNKRIPSLNDALIGLIAILPHSVMTVGSYSLLFAYGLNLTIFLFSILFTTFFILSALFSNDFYTFVFTIFSAVFSPVLFVRSFESKQKFDQNLDCQNPRLSSTENVDNMKNIYRYRFMSRQFYGINKLITSVFLLCCMAPLVFLVNSEATEGHIYGAHPFQFKIYHQTNNLTTLFNCRNYCQAKLNNDTCTASCNNERPADPGSTSVCSRICENIQTSEHYFKIKKDTCRSLQLTSPTLLNISFSIFAIFAITSILDSLLILSPNFDWSPSYMLLFNISSEKDRNTINAVTMELTPLRENESCPSKKIPRKKDYNRPFFQNYSYRAIRLSVGIFGYLWVKFKVIRRSVTDYYNDDVWWCFLGLACIVMPTIPVVIKYLQRKIEDINSQPDTSKVKPFFKLLFFTIIYLFGGFLLFTVYRICYKVYCTWQNVKDPTGNENEMKYRRKEVEMNLTQALLESAPDGLLKLYRLLQFEGDVPALMDLLLNVLLRAISVTGIITRGHFIVRDGSIVVKSMMLFFGYLAVLPEIVFRWLTYAVILVANTWLGHNMVKLFTVIYFFQASITGKNFETAVHSVFSSFTSPFMFVKDFDVENRRKEVQTKDLKTFYCMNKKTTSFILLCFLILCKYKTDYQIEDSSRDVEYNITVCNWIQNLTNSVTNYAGENEDVDKTCSLQFLFPVLIAFALLSLVDGIFTLLYEKSPSSLLIFPKERNKTIGVKNFIIDTSDLLKALENRTNTGETTSLIEDGINTLPIENFGEGQIPYLKAKAEEWNQNQSDESLFINAEMEEMTRGRLYNIWWPVTSVHIEPSVGWNDRVSYEERGPVTGMRIWRTNGAIYGLQLKYGEIWEEERGEKFNSPACCCYRSIEKYLEMSEFTLDRGEMINSIQTKTNYDTGRLFRLRFGTTKDWNKWAYDSSKSVFTAGNFLRPWDVEDWPHNNDFEQSEALALAYCSGRDEAGSGVGRILSFHWVAREDVVHLESENKSVTSQTDSFKCFLCSEIFLMKANLTEHETRFHMKTAANFSQTQTVSSTSKFQQTQEDSCVRGSFVEYNCFYCGIAINSESFLSDHSGACHGMNSISVNPNRLNQIQCTSEQEDVTFPALARRMSTEDVQTTHMEYQIKHITI